MLHIFILFFLNMRQQNFCEEHVLFLIQRLQNFICFVTV